MNIVDMLINDEGLKLKPYRCQAGKLTIGVGRNLEDRGISSEEAVYLLRNDIQECIKDLEQSVFRGVWTRFPEHARVVFTNMRFQLGYSGFRGFRKMIAAARVMDWPEVATQMKDSAWYTQTTARATRLIRIIERL